MSLGHIRFNFGAPGRNNVTSSLGHGATRGHLSSWPRPLLISKAGWNASSHSLRPVRTLGPRGDIRGRPRNWQREGCWTQVRGRLAWVSSRGGGKEARQSSEGRTGRIWGWSSLRGREKLVRRTGSQENVQPSGVFATSSAGPAAEQRPSATLRSASCPTCSPNVFFLLEFFFLF